MTENMAIRLMLKANRSGIDAIAESVGGPTSGNWSVHLEHGRRIINDAAECQTEIVRIRGHKGGKPS